MVKYPGMWYFCLMSQHRFHNVKEQKRAKVLSFFRNKSAKLKTLKTKCNFAQKAKNRNPFECHFHSFFSVDVYL